MSSQLPLSPEARRAYILARVTAIGIVNQARRNGVLTDLKKASIACVDCGAKATQYDHRDYRRPLDVVPVCHRCNLKRGPANLQPFLDGEQVSIGCWVESFAARLFYASSFGYRTQSAQTP